MEKIDNLRNKLTKMSNEELINYAISQEIAKDQYLEQLTVMRTKMFQKTSEKIDPNQVSLFNEAEYVFEASDEEKSDETRIQSKPRNRGKKKKEVDFSNIETRTIHHSLEDKTCSACGGTLIEIGTKVVEVLKFQRAEYFMERHVIHEYACKNCGMESVPEDAPVRLIEGSKVSSSVVAGIASNKFMMDIPLYRQEKDLNRQGIMISRANMSNWLIRCSDDYLQYVFKEMHKDVQALDILHVDETTHVCIEDKKGSREKSYEWLVVSGMYEPKQMALYFYSENREYDTLNDILTVNTDRFIQSDGYGAYHNESYGTDVACMAHIRRKIFEAATASPLYPRYKKCKSDEERKAILESSPSFANQMELLGYIQKLSKIDDEIKNVNMEDKLRIKIEKSLPVFNALYQKIESIIGDYTEKSKMGIALRYAINEKKYMKNYYLDGRLELTNNRAERQIKSFVMARKNFLFSSTSRGANSSSIYMSLIESAKMNGLDPIRYIEYVLERLSREGLKDKVIKEVLPYSPSIPKEIKSKSSNK